MNSTSFNESTIIIESWFMPLNIIMIMFTSIAILCSLFFLYLIISDKTCRTVPMMFIVNTCLSELVLGSDLLGMSVFTLKNDLQQIQLQDSLCNFRGYVCTASCAALNYSFALQAFYRYVTVVYPTRLFWKSSRNQLVLICFTWILAVVEMIPVILINGAVYNVHNQICQPPLRFGFSIIYVALCVYVIPNSTLIFIYFGLVRYVHEASARATPANILIRAQRELKMVQRMVILVTILITLGLPYFIFILMSFFTDVYIYHFRIAFLFVDVALAFVMIALFQFTDPLKASLKKLINGRPNQIIATVA